MHVNVMKVMSFENYVIVKKISYNELSNKKQDIRSNRYPKVTP